MDRGAWQATVHRVTKSQAQLKWLGTYFRLPSNSSSMLPWKISSKIQIWICLASAWACISGFPFPEKQACILSHTVAFFFPFPVTSGCSFPRIPWYFSDVYIDGASCLLLLLKDSHSVQASGQDLPFLELSPDALLSFPFLFLSCSPFLFLSGLTTLQLCPHGHLDLSLSVTLVAVQAFLFRVHKSCLTTGTLKTETVVYVKFLKPHNVSQYINIFKLLV